jgi:hypothetical protein
MYALGCVRCVKDVYAFEGSILLKAWQSSGFV